VYLDRDIKNALTGLEAKQVLTSRTLHMYDARFRQAIVQRQVLAIGVEP
jgi:hypothetical protein